MGVVGRWMDRRRADNDDAVEILLENCPGGLGGYDIATALGWRAGRLYPTLTRLEAVGRIASDWQPGPYPRRIYKVER